MASTRSASMVPLLSAVIRRGIDAGLFTAASPDDAASAVVSLTHGCRDAATEVFIARQANAPGFKAAKGAAK